MIMSCSASAPRRGTQAPRQSLPSLGRQARTVAMWQRDGCNRLDVTTRRLERAGS
jgi:hypothetical protein